MRKDEYFEKFNRLLEKYKRSQGGLHTWAVKDLNDAPITDELKEVLITMVKENLVPSKALMAIEGLIETRPKLFSEFNEIVPQIKKYLLDESSVRMSALGVLIKAQYPGLKNEVFKMIKENKPDPLAYVFALLKEYNDPSIIPDLIKFKDDPTLEETEGMGGTLRFIFRDKAFETIEHLAKKEFLKKDSTDLVESQWAYWWNWKPVLEWWENEGNTNSNQGFFAKFLKK